MGKPGVAGVYMNQRLNLSKLWEGSRKTCQGLELGSGNPTVQDFRGASGTVRQGENVNPSCSRKSRHGNPSPTARRARFLSQPESPEPRDMGVQVPCRVRAEVPPRRPQPLFFARETTLTPLARRIGLGHQGPQQQRSGKRHCRDAQKTCRAA